MDAKVPRKVRRMVPLCPAASMRLCGGLSANGPRAASPESGGSGTGAGVGCGAERSLRCGR